MKTRILSAVCALCFGFLAVNSARAGEMDEIAVMSDALVARPLCFAATIVGGAIFVVALPVAATSGSIDSTAHTLVGRPAWATFKRPIGDFSFATDYSMKHPSKAERKAIARKSKPQKTAKQ